MKRMRFTKNQMNNLLQWAQWLETTSLRQYTNGALYNDGIIYDEGIEGYCCLGVYIKYHYDAATISVRDTHLHLKDEDNKLITVYEEMYYLALKDRVKLGLTKVLHNAFQTFNDVLGYDFMTIAAEIKILVQTGKVSSDASEALKKNRELICHRFPTWF